MFIIKPKEETSGGTTETIFTMDGVGKEMRDPFVLNPENTVSEEQREKSKDGFSIEEVDGLEGWSGVGVMAMANTKKGCTKICSFDGTKSKTLWKKLYFWRARLICFKEKCKASFLRSSIRLYSLKYTFKVSSETLFA